MYIDISTSKFGMKSDYVGCNYKSKVWSLSLITQVVLLIRPRKTIPKKNPRSKLAL